MMDATLAPRTQPSVGACVDAPGDLYQPITDLNDIYRGSVAEDHDRMWKQARYRFAIASAPWDRAASARVGSFRG